jgi:hypothetical protein
MSSPFGTSHDWPFSAPQLKAMQFDGGLDFNSGKIVWWLFARLDDAITVPRRKPGRQFAATIIAGECVERAIRFRLENVDPHG